MQRFLYNLALLAATPWALGHLLWRARRQPAYLAHWSERFGRYAGLSRARTTGAGRCLWLHAVSVGETRAAQPLLALLRQRQSQYPVLLTHMTPTGRQTSKDLFGDDIARAYLPYDYPWAVERFLEHFQPALGIIMETELWPNLVAASRRRDIPLLLINARLSERSAATYRRFPGLTRQTLGALAGVGAQGAADARRLTELGASNVRVTGNIKFDIAPPPEQLERGAALRSLWRAEERRVFLAASTREGEEAVLFKAWRPHAEKALLVVVPRHPQRFAEVATLAAASGFKVQRRSENAPLGHDTGVLIGDSMGEMFAYYAACDVAFIGGSLLDYGSQNPIEACAAAAPLLIGPSSYNFSEVAQEAIACGAARRVSDVHALVAAALDLLGSPPARQAMAEAGRAFVARHRGAAERSYALIESYLSRGVTSPA